MNLGKNIAAAFEVVYKTHVATDKLIKCIKENYDKDKFKLIFDKFLRYSSDPDPEGWCYYSLILLFQRTTDEKCSNGYLNGPIYVVEINFKDFPTPKIIIAKLTYNDIDKWDKNKIKQGVYDIFHEPIIALQETMTKTSETDCSYTATPIPEKVKAYWDLQEVKAKLIELVDINDTNYQDLIFGTIDELAKNQVNDPFDKFNFENT